MISSGAEALINARTAIVWDVLTDTSNVTVWDSGITEIVGDMRDGGTIRIRRDNRRRHLSLRVEQLPGRVMQWRAGVPFGLLRRAFTVVATPEYGQVHLRIRHEISGPLAFLAAKKTLVSQARLQVFVDAVKERAELIDRHI